MNSLVVGSRRNNNDSCEQILELLAQDFKDCDESPVGQTMSQNDKQALTELNQIVKKNYHYSVGLL